MSDDRNEKQILPRREWIFNGTVFTNLPAMVRAIEDDFITKGLRVEKGEPKPERPSTLTFRAWLEGGK